MKAGCSQGRKGGQGEMRAGTPHPRSAQQHVSDFFSLAQRWQRCGTWLSVTLRTDGLALAQGRPGGLTPALVASSEAE